jgi:hypothetical protein
VIAAALAGGVKDAVSGYIASVGKFVAFIELAERMSREA